MKELFTAINNPTENGKTIFQVRFTTDEPRAYDAALEAGRQVLDGQFEAAAPRDRILERRKGEIVYICSPYRGDTERNTLYAQQLVMYAVNRGLSPICPHLYLPQILDDNKPEERERALHVGQELLSCCDMLLVGKRYGISEGMQAEIDRARSLGIQVRYVEHIYIEG